MTQAAIIADLLGGSKTLKHRVIHDDDLVKIAREGIPARAVRELANNSSSSVVSLVEAAGMSLRTYDRRSAANGKLKTIEGNGLLRIARAVAHARSVLGEDNGVKWLHQPNRALGAQVPISMLDTETGARLVEQILGRIEHGVFS